MQENYRKLITFKTLGAGSAFETIATELQTENSVFVIDKKLLRIINIKNCSMKKNLEYITRSFEDSDEVEFYVKEFIEKNTVEESEVNE